MNRFDMGRAELIRNFPYGNENDIYIRTVGYNNFDIVKPIKWIHRQLGYTLHYVIEGSGKLHLCGREFNVSEKQLFFLPPNEEQMYYPDEDNKWKYVWFYFSGNQAARLGEEMGFSLDAPIKIIKKSIKIEDALLCMMEEAQKGTLNQYMAKSILYKIAGSLCARESNENMMGGCVLEAANFLETNFAYSDFSVETLCDLLYISHSALCKAFKKEYNTTPLKYLIEIRMKHAAMLLCDGDAQIKDIAALSGYRDEIHFMKTFKKFYGVTASEFRQKKQCKGRKE